MHFRNGFSRFLGVALGLLYLANSALSIPAENVGLNMRKAEDACAEIAVMVNVDGESNIPADLAHSCLKSVPFDSKRALYITKQMRLFSQLYSAQAFFKKPLSPELHIKPVDLNATFDAIEKKASEKKYANDYEFQTDVMKLYGSFQDGHTYYLPECAAPYTFWHDYPLVPIYNEEGVQTIWYADIDTGELQEEIVEIDGEEVSKYLENLSMDLAESGYLDHDARYNSLFMRQTPDGFTHGDFYRRTIYSGSSIKMKTKAGAEVEAKWMMYISSKVPWKDSESYFEEVCIDPDNRGVVDDSDEKEANKKDDKKDDDFDDFDEDDEDDEDDEFERRKREIRRRSPPPRKTRSTLMSRATVNHWPKLALTLGKGTSPQQTIHLLDDNTAVWGIHSFSKDEGTDIKIFYEQWGQFNKDAAKMLKDKKIKRIIIELSGNGGGYIDLAVLSIHNFFPDSQPFYGWDIRRSPAMDLLLKNSALSNTSHLELNNTKDIHNKDFASLEAFMGPVYKYGDYFTNIARWDIADHLEIFHLPAKADPLFSTDNIVILSDGLCGSVCVTFTEAMSNLGVKTVAIGGVPDKPADKKQMQAVGGIKGSQIWTWARFQWHVKTYVETPEKYDFLPKPLPYKHDSGLTFRNSYAPDSDLPLEFIWQPANAHVYQTKEMWNDRATLYKAVAVMSWDEGGKNILPAAQTDIRNGGVSKETKPDAANSEEVVTDDDGEPVALISGIDNWALQIVLQFGSTSLWGFDWKLEWSKYD